MGLGKGGVVWGLERAALYGVWEGRRCLGFGKGGIVWGLETIAFVSDF
jgi:hypothetical protein